ELAVNPLARPLVPALSEAETARLAQKAIGPLYTGWKNASGGLPTDQRGAEAARLALLGHAPPEIINTASYAGANFLFYHALDAETALDLVRRALAALDRANAAPDLYLLRLGADSAERLGRVEIQE